ncbi:hypothetical protein JCM10296v2_007520 [Rhodotorula toruloides]
MAEQTSLDSTPLNASPGADYLILPTELFSTICELDPLHGPDLWPVVLEGGEAGILPALKRIVLHDCVSGAQMARLPETLHQLRRYPQLRLLHLHVIDPYWERSDFRRVKRLQTQPLNMDWIAYLDIDSPEPYRSAFLQLLQACSSLTELSLHVHRYGATVAAAIQALPNQLALQHLTLHSTQSARPTLPADHQLHNLFTLTLEDRLPLESILPSLSSLRRLERLVCSTETVATDDFLTLLADDTMRPPCFEEIVCDFSLRPHLSSRPGVDFKGMSQILELAARVGVQVTGKTVKAYKVEQRWRALKSSGRGSACSAQ